MAPGGARDVMLTRIREALGHGPTAVAIPRDYERTLPAGTAIAELFVERVSDYRATVHRTTSADMRASIGAVLAERGARRLATTRPPRPASRSARRSRRGERNVHAAVPNATASRVGTR